MRTRPFSVIALMVIVLSLLVSFTGAANSYMSSEQVCHSFDGVPDPHKWIGTATGKVVCVFQNIANPSALESNPNLFDIEIKQVIAGEQSGRYKVILHRAVNKTELCTIDIPDAVLPECNKIILNPE